MRKIITLLIVFTFLFPNFFGGYVQAVTTSDDETSDTELYYSIKIVEDISIGNVEDRTSITLLVDTQWLVKKNNDEYILLGTNFTLPKESIQIIDEITPIETEDTISQKSIKGKVHVNDHTPLYSDEEFTNSVGILHQALELNVFEETDVYYKVYLGDHEIFIPKHQEEQQGNGVDENQSQIEDSGMKDQKQTETKAKTQLTIMDTQTREYTSNDKYFKVITSDVNINFKSSNKFYPVGKLTEGQVYPIERIVGNWIEVKFGARYGYIWKNSTEPTNEKPNKLANNQMNFSLNVRTKQSLPVYDNSTGSLIKIGELNSGVEYPIIREVGNWAEIVYAGRIGYIYKSNYTKQFTENDKYFKVISPNVNINFKTSNKFYPVGRLMEGEVYPIERIVGNWLEVKFGARTGYIWKKSAEPTSERPKKIADNNLRFNLNVKTKKLLPVYDNSTGSLMKIGELDAELEYPIIKQAGNWIEILYAGRIGYIYYPDVELQFSNSVKYFEVTADQLPIYRNINGKMVKVGELIKGQQYERTGVKGNWHEIRVGNRTGYTWAPSTKPILNISYRNSLMSKESTNWLEITNDVRIYDNTSGKLVPFAMLKKGETAPYYEKAGNWYKISAFGRVGYVYADSVVVRAQARDIVNPLQTYTYEQMRSDIYQLESSYPDLIDVHTIGYSVDGRNIYAVKLGKGNVEITINAAHHAREHITTNLVMEMMDEYAQAYANSTKIDNYNVRDLLDKTSIWFVPMVNPDGVTLVQKGHMSAKNPSQVLRLNGFNTNFRAWKANVRGVDLNRQYPAGWDTIKNNPGKPGPQNYKGTKPLSEPEVQALHYFTLQHDFKTAVAYHSSGEVLYWNYKQDPARYTRDQRIAKMISNKTGYSLVYPGPNPSGGGYTDWFINSQKKPSFTPEVSPYVGPRPVPISNFIRIWNQNDSIGLMLAEEAYINRNNR